MLRYFSSGLPCWLCSKEDMGLIPGSGRCLGEGNGNTPSIPVGEMPWTEDPGGLQSMGSQKSQTRLSN